MGMCRIILADGKVMHLPAVFIDVQDGHLRLLGKDGKGQKAIFAPGIWAYWVWVHMSDGLGCPET